MWFPHLFLVHRFGEIRNVPSSVQDCCTPVCCHPKSAVHRIDFASERANGEWLQTQHSWYRPPCVDYPHRAQRLLKKIRPVPSPADPCDRQNSKTSSCGQLDYAAHRRSCSATSILRPCGHGCGIPADTSRSDAWMIAVFDLYPRKPACIPISTIRPRQARGATRL